MQSETQTAPVSKKMLWAGRMMSALPILFLLVEGVLIWGGLYLRDERLRALLPLRKGESA